MKPTVICFIILVAASSILTYFSLKEDEVEWDEYRDALHDLAGRSS